MSAEPLRAIVLHDVEAEARTTDAESEAEAIAVVERARAEATSLAEQARREGATAGDLERARERAEARRRAQRLVLEARRGAYDAFREQAHAAAARLRQSDRYAALLQRLAAAVREQLGEDAALEVDPAGVGGVRGRRGGRAVDYTLPVLVDRCIASLGSEVDKLWS